MSQKVPKVKPEFATHVPSTNTHSVQMRGHVGSGLRANVGYRQGKVTCKHHSILCKGLEHPRIMGRGWGEGSWSQSSADVKEQLRVLYSTSLHFCSPSSIVNISTPTAATAPDASLTGGPSSG